MVDNAIKEREEFAKGGKQVAAKESYQEAKHQAT